MRRRPTTTAPVQTDPPPQVVARGPRPLFSGTVLIGPDGYWSQNVGRELHSMALSNTGNFWMVAELAAPQSAIPEYGAGVHHLEPGGRERRLPAWGHVITLYGTPGERVGLVLWTAENVNF